jgi:uncharacterized surface protein with fasciclin (FAS1) repeats
MVFTLHKNYNIMKIYQTISKLLFVTAIGTIVTFSSCKKDDPAPVPVPTPVTNTVTDIVSANASFTLLKQAVVKADLAGALAGAGPFTVFAPDDAAFTAATFTAAGITATPAAALSTVLKYHVISGSKILAANVPAGPNAKVVTLGGDSIFVTRKASGSVFINGVQVTGADIPADNGVIHKVGRVIQPAAGNIVATAQAVTGGANGLDSLVKAILRVNGATVAQGGDPSLVATLSGTTPGAPFAPLTVFAPTNAAFTQLLTALGNTDINQIAISTLNAVLKYHVVGGRAFSSDLTTGSLTMLPGGVNTTAINLVPTVPTITGRNSVLNLSVGGSTTNTCGIIGTDVMCRNGVVHLINRVLLP